VTTDYTHVLFADESHHNKGRFRAVGAVTAERGAGIELYRWYTDHLRKQGCSAIEFKKLNSGQTLRAAQRAIPGIVDRLSAGKVRLDVLVWDTEDSRHQIPGRDDRENLGRMYYRAVRTCLARRWPDDISWRVFVDQDALPDTDDFQRILGGKTGRPGDTLGLLRQGVSEAGGGHIYDLARTEETTSERQPLLQIADLFAGLAVVSRAKYARYLAWLNAESGQQTMFDDAPQKPPSRREEAQFMLISAIHDACRQRALGVSLQSTQGLETRKPSNPMNFWLYRPQHEADKAPTKGWRP
jgi:hypothetical protein